MDVEVSVAQLKAKLSEYLRLVDRGVPVTVQRHGRAVARLVPLGDGADDLVIHPATQDPATWADVQAPPFRLDRDIVTYLLEDRADRDRLAPPGRS